MRWHFLPYQHKSSYLVSYFINIFGFVSGYSSWRLRTFEEVNFFLLPLQIRSHAQKYFLKVQKNGTSEHVPPPRPKRKAAHPYPQKAPKGFTDAEPFFSVLFTTIMNDELTFNSCSSSCFPSQRSISSFIWFFGTWACCQTWWISIAWEFPYGCGLVFMES